MNLLPITGDLVRALGWSILHALWQAFFVYACLKIVLKLWPMASARIKYNLSFFALSGIFTWFLITFYQQWQTVTVARQLLVQYTPMEVAELAPQTAVPYTGQLRAIELFPSLEQCFPILVTLYLAGMLLMAIKFTSDLVQLHHIRTTMVEPMGEAWEKHLQQLMKRLQLSRPVKLLISRYIQVPVMLGFLKPVILLPVAMVNNLSEEQLEAILLHELAHVKRNDYLLNIFQSIVETILFFNPFVWLISRIIRQEREHCCDDLVIAGTVQPLHYAQALMALETYRLTSNPMAMAAADDKQHLFHRIKRIMEMKTKHLNYSQKLLAVLIIASGLVSIAWLNPAKGKDNRQKDPQFTMVADTSIPNFPVPPPPPAAPKTPPPPPDAPPAPPEPVIVADPAVVPDVPEMPELDDNAMAKLPALQNMIVMNAKGSPMVIMSDSTPVHFSRTRDTEKMKKQLRQAQQSVEQAMQRLKDVDMKKIQAEAQTAVNKVDWQAIAKETQEAQQEAREALKNIDWKQIQQDIDNSLDVKFDFNDENWKNDNAKMHADRKKMHAEMVHQQKAMKVARERMMAANKQRMMIFRDSSMQYNRKQMMDKSRESVFRQAESARLEADKARSRADGARLRANASNKNFHEMISKMADDKLIDNKQTFTIEKNGNGLYINGVKQPDNVADKYRQYLQNERTYIRQAEPGNLNINVEN